MPKLPFRARAQPPAVLLLDSIPRTRAITCTISLSTSTIEGKLVAFSEKCREYFRKKPIRWEDSSPTDVSFVKTDAGSVKVVEMFRSEIG